MSEPVVIKQNLQGTVLFAIVSLAFSLLCLWCVFTDFESLILSLISQNIAGYYILKILMVIGFIFFGYGFFFFMKKAKSGKAMLIVDEKGITDNSSALAFGFIPWKDINRIYMDSLWVNGFISVELNNEEYYINKFKGLRKAAVLANKKMGHQAVCISLNSSGVSPYTIFPKMQEMFLQAKSR